MKSRLKKIQVRLISPWSPRLETEHAVFSAQLGAEDADALLCMWAPSSELATFPRRKAWYCCEPQCQFEHLENGKWVEIRNSLRAGEFLYHNHKNSIYRVPHITHYEDLEVVYQPRRLSKAIAVVSNTGGHPLRAHGHVRFRNSIITSANVDLYGRSGWLRYRRRWYSLPRAPKNYCGEIPGDWPAHEKRRMMSQYKVCVCLENMNEPGYFTEKFVEAVLAGCIPVYRASPDVRETFLQGAAWFDPGDSRWPGPRAVDAALQASWADVVEVNSRWLKTNAFLQSSRLDLVMSKIAAALEK